MILRFFSQLELQLSPPFLISIVLKSYLTFFKKGHKRTIKAKKNIAFSFILKAIDIGTGLLLVPLVLNYLDETRYGIWLTLSSFVLWFNFFDVGLGHGLRNKLSESQATGNEKLSQKYVSTAYASLAIISGGFFGIFLIINQFIDWSVILNTTTVSKDELNLLAVFVFGFFALRFILKLVFSVLLADQSPAMKDLIQTTGKLINITAIYILLQTTKDSLLYLGISYSVSPVVVLFVFSIILFTKKYKHIAPKFKCVDFNLFNDLFNIGVKFFIIQISAVVIYSTDNMIITHLFSPADVTPYQIAHRYFSILLMGFAIVVAPFWSAITEAYIKGEIGWIKQSVKKLMQIWGAIIVVLVLMLIISNKVYQMWIGDRVIIPYALSAAWAIFIAIQSLNMIFVQVINGTGKVKLQMFLGIIGAIINIPLSILLAKYFNLGITGVISATIFTQVLAIGFVIVQYKKIVSGQLHGIWGK